VNPRLFAVAIILILASASCAKRNSSADIREVKRLAVAEGLVGVDTLSMMVNLVHAEVAVVTSFRLVVKPGSDTLRVPEIMVYVLTEGKWRLRLEG
jgi:hypothetical protein